MALWRESGDDRGLSLVTQNLGLAHSGAGHHEQAITLLEESVVLARRAGDPAHLGSTLRSLGRASLLGGRDPGPVLEVMRESVELSRRLADRPGLVESLETVAAIVDPGTGAELIGAAEAARDAADASRQPDEEAWVVETKASLREQLGEDAFATAVQRGRELTLVTAVARAVGV